MTEFLFSYGTLQVEKVQIESFGRLLVGGDDVLENYKLRSLEILDESVLAKSAERFHPIAVFTGMPEDTITGKVFEVSMEEILSADQYEVSDYKRISAPLRSGKNAWVYVAAK